MTDSIPDLIAWNNKRSMKYADDAAEALRLATSGEYARMLEGLSAQHSATAAALESLSAPPASDDEREALADAIELGRQEYLREDIPEDGLSEAQTVAAAVAAAVFRRLSPLALEPLLSVIAAKASILNDHQAGELAEAILSSLSVPEHAGRFTLAQVATEIRLHCTLDWEVTKKGGDALIYAVADWVENPPEWVTALSVPEPAEDKDPDVSRMKRLQRAVRRLAGRSGDDISQLIEDGLLEEGDL